MAKDIAISNAITHFEYDHALKVYLQHRGEDFLFRTIFSKSKNDYAKEKLKSELSELLKEIRSNSSAVAESQPFIDIDDDINTKKQEALKALKKAAHLRGQLEVETDKGKRFNLVKEIVRLREINAGNWRAVKTYHKKGYLPEPVKAVNTTVKLSDKLQGIESLVHARNNARCNVTKHRKKGNERLLKKWEAIRDELDQQIQNHE